jgi:hypothetical protein
MCSTKRGGDLFRALLENAGVLLFPNMRDVMVMLLLETVMMSAAGDSMLSRLGYVVLSVVRIS